MPDNDNKKNEEKKEDRPKSIRNKMDATTQTQKQLEKLFQKIDRPVEIPERPKKESTIKPPKEFVRNVPGNRRIEIYMIGDLK